MSKQQPFYDIFGNLVKTPLNPRDKEEYEDPSTLSTGKGLDFPRSKEEEEFDENKENVMPGCKEPQTFTPLKPRKGTKALPRSPFLDITPPASKKTREKNSSGRRGLLPREGPLSPLGGFSNSSLKQFR